MSSSGLIYAFIVGAWAVYLVPMWLRREDELNKARQTQRYTTAIKVLSHKDSFERRYGAADEQEQARELPLAAGQSGPAPTAGQRTLDRIKQKERERTVASAPSARRVTAKVAASGSRSEAPAKRKPGSAPISGKSGSAKSGSVSGNPGSGKSVSGNSARGNTVSGNSGSAQESSSSVWTPAPLSSSAPSPSQSSASASGGVGPRSGLRARRRKVVGFLFALTSLGAIVSADLGLGYVWAMLLPAAALTTYIAWCRKDERARAAERARRHAVAVRAAHEAERRELEQQRQLEEAERLEREELARRNAVARRRVAAARSRAERRTTPGSPDQGDLPRAANG
ncbi:hypothetical protein [Actinospica sp.]|jgi:hypothetical protein|uniref:hypothetical protein n=1 Tax=Actinospica sp. TaxID=1872142 RepID=UPI002CE353B1|nr:hypothetical protein [Actinospica sp.]HWG24874.1 hypothetical protein [Actinospica sp.]